MWKELREALPYWNRSQLSSSVDDELDEFVEFDEFDELEEDLEVDVDLGVDDDDSERGASADAADVAVAADVAMRARAVSCVPSALPVLASFASSAERALSSDRSRCDNGRSVAAPLESTAVALALAVVDDLGGVAAAED
jgi:hypothetical protein